MDKKAIIAGLVVIILLFAGFSLHRKQQTRIQTLNDEVSQLQEKSASLKEEKEMLESKEAKAKELHTVENQDSNAEVDSFVNDYLEAMYNYSNNTDRNEALKPFVTATYNQFVESFGTTDSVVPFESKLNNVDIYRTSESMVLVRINYSFKVADNDKVDYDLLLTLEVEKGAIGGYLVNKQFTESIQKQNQQKVW
ncbi:hypothetical protein [Isobaculum melis]|uniref:Uncharacterized protein n=1 Tax=Isobaculum melis TaxID=142588 RepID=A0A1H9TQ99_9LACT|nr:hypothetical protein [Isobaculum melis]SER99194.1 hypothetical protein SAMN04488559_11551 [Isobaculum melis]